MQKRPSAKIPPEVLTRAVELRRAGKTVRAIAEEVGYSKSAVHEAVKGVGLGDPATVTAEDLERAAEYEQNAQSASLVARAMIHDFGRRVNGPTSSAFAGRDLDSVVRAAVGFQKLAALMRGQANWRSASEASDAPEPDAEERLEIRRLTALLLEGATTGGNTAGASAVTAPLGGVLTAGVAAEGAEPPPMTEPGSASAEPGRSA